MTTLEQDHLIDPEPYELPIPKRNGHLADKLTVGFGGTLELDPRRDPKDLELLEQLRFGREVQLTVTFLVNQDGWALRTAEDSDTLGYRIGLKAVSVQQ